MNIPPILVLLGAILSEILATYLLKESNGFTRTIPAIFSVVTYGLVLYLLSLSLNLFPMGPVYAIWSGVGIAFTALLGWLVWHENLNWVQLAGMALIMLGAAMIVLTSGRSEYG
jgi:small multidrug resistance pump